MSAEHVHVMRCLKCSEEYSGWTNRETWAVALWINNDQGWQESVLEELGDAFSRLVEDLSAGKAGEIVRENVERLFDPEEYEGQSLPAGVVSIMQDIGSLWRVDWYAIGESFLQTLAEQDQ